MNNQSSSDKEEHVDDPNLRSQSSDSQVQGTVYQWEDSIDLSCNTENTFLPEDTEVSGTHI